MIIIVLFRNSINVILLNFGILFSIVQIRLSWILFQEWICHLLFCFCDLNCSMSAHKLRMLLLQEHRFATTVVLLRGRIETYFFSIEWNFTCVCQSVYFWVVLVVFEPVYQIDLISFLDWAFIYFQARLDDSSKNFFFNLCVGIFVHCIDSFKTLKLNLNCVISGGMALCQFIRHFLIR